MVICKNHNFLFVRTPKNASSSLATYFVQNFCDKNDIYTEINDSNIKNHNVPSTLKQKYRTHYHFIHMTVQEICNENILTIDEAHQMQKISVIRCPLERQISLYFFLRRNKPKSVDEFRHIFRNGCHDTDSNNQIRQVDYLKIDGKLDDKSTFWPYPKLSEKLADFRMQKGVQQKEPLPNHKSKYTPKKQNLIDIYYDEKTKNAVLDYYSEDYKMYESLYPYNK